MSDTIDHPAGGRDAERVIVRELLTEQKFAVLSTQSGGQPYGSLVAFATDESLDYVVFATHRNTRKYANMSTNPHIALIVDNRTNSSVDLVEGAALTLTGEAEELGFAEWDTYAPAYLAKFPQLREFLESKNCALLRLSTRSYALSGSFLSTGAQGTP